MTALLQPLDVAVNRSFQTYYEQQFADYVDKSLLETENTKKGHVKVPDYNTVATWVIDWTKSYRFNAERNPFVICGYVHPSKYDASQLHEPLQVLVQQQKNIDEWESLFKDDLYELKDMYDGDEELHYFPPESEFTLRDAIKSQFPDQCKFLNAMNDDIIDDRVLERIGIELDAVIEVISISQDLYIDEKVYLNKVEPVAMKTITIGRMDDYYFIKKNEN